MHSTMMGTALMALAALAATPLLATAQDCPECRQGRHDGRHAQVASWGQPGNPGYGNQLDCRANAAVPADLFYNYYHGGNCGSMAASMYPAPYPTSPLSGHSWYTYQPLLPHEYMYKHHRSYHSYYDGGRGLTRTHVSWGGHPVASSLKGIRRGIELPR